eukprot:1516205-Pleurochrysis_carterae.AAC.2
MIGAMTIEPALIVEKGCRMRTTHPRHKHNMYRAQSHERHLAAGEERKHGVPMLLLLHGALERVVGARALRELLDGGGDSLVDGARLHRARETQPS